MLSKLIKDEKLSNKAPVNKLSYGTNCVAMAFSRVLGIGDNAAINLFIAKGWVPSAQALQFDNAIETIVARLPLQNKFLNESWQNVKPHLSRLSDGRYFAINSGVNQFGGQGIGHAFAIIKHGGWGTYANNAEKSGYNYSSTINDAYYISVWGPS